MVTVDVEAGDRRSGSRSATRSATRSPEREGEGALVNGKYSLDIVHVITLSILMALKLVNSVRICTHQPFPEHYIKI